MPRLSGARRPFEPRTEVWRQAGLGSEVDRHQAKRARGEVVLAVPSDGAKLADEILAAVREDGDGASAKAPTSSA
ncbi:MAG TPA: hypothetical protein VEK39_05380 [Solirubrobacterales bacterium]|nr:hypothetical protein [Solirubrobacterales bacterium]